MKSKLDPEVYGPAESAITKEIVEEEIRGFMTLEEVTKYIICDSFSFRLVHNREVLH